MNRRVRYGLADVVRNVVRITYCRRPRPFSESFFAITRVSRSSTDTASISELLFYRVPPNGHSSFVSSFVSASLVVFRTDRVRGRLAGGFFFLFFFDAINGSTVTAFGHAAARLNKTRPVLRPRHMRNFYYWPSRSFHLNINPCHSTALNRVFPV